jgi:OOP family OmpA-OmpF porin
MKHLNKLLVAVMMVMGLSSHAQDSSNPWAISFGANAVDTRTSAGGTHNGFSRALSQPFLIKKNWNILPSPVSYVGVSRYIGQNFSFGVTGSVNRINRYVNQTPEGGYVVSNPWSGNEMYYAVDANIKYSLMNLIGSKVVDPALAIGGGYTFFGRSSFGTINPGVNITFWFTEHFGLEVGTKYKWALDATRNDIDGVTPKAPTHFQHNLGLVFKFGAKDSDHDGVSDKDDACPEVAGLKKFKGCPDTDGDGIQDSADACPDVFGLAALNGCPDADGDGVADKDDACPNEFGLAALNGCPDADADGVADKDDKCPNIAGPKENAGCPWADTDGDGVYDNVDACPNVAGPASNRGCPEISAEVLDNLKIQARAVYFNSGKATLKSGDTGARLDAMANILKNYPNAKFRIEGHTDSDGSNAANLKLSQERADVVKNALVERGIDSANLKAVGYGESRPVATNKTAKGKAQNRRTEIILQK